MLHGWRWMMPLSPTRNIQTGSDALDSYVAAVRAVTAQFGRIAADKRAISGNLSRAAAALRSMATVHSSPAVPPSKHRMS